MQHQDARQAAQRVAQAVRQVGGATRLAALLNLLILHGKRTTPLWKADGAMACQPCSVHPCSASHLPAVQADRSEANGR